MALTKLEQFKFDTLLKALGMDKNGLTVDEALTLAIEAECTDTLNF